MKTRQNTVGIYIHWPYCLSKCPYCDFASSPCRNYPEDVLLEGYLRDIRQNMPAGLVVGSVFFGGGTPSLMTPNGIERVLNAVTSVNPLAENCEITMEANPDAITFEKMKDFKQAGINRLSLGVQSLVEKDLVFLGRRHSVQTALQRVDEAQKIFDRINIDLIYARPQQSESDWERELQTAIGLNLGHYSLYQLTIEPNTVFGKNSIDGADEKMAERLYCLTDEIMNRAGCPAYEVSNYAKNGEESRHNLLYWTGGDYVAVGPAAHGRIGMETQENPADIRTWLTQGTQKSILSPAEKKEELLLMGLRLRRHPFPVKGLNPESVEKAQKNGWIIIKPDGIYPTQAGILVLNRLILLLSD